MVKKLHFTILLIASFSFAQSGDYDFNAAEANVRKLLGSNPAKALPIIKKTLEQDNIHDTIYGKAYNLYGIYYGIKGRPDSTIYYTEKSIGYLAKYPKLRVKSLMNLAIGYRNKGKHALSIKLLNEAAAIQKKLKNEAGLGIVYGELATNYNYIADYEKSIDLLLKAIPLLSSAKNQKELFVIKQKLAGTYLSKQNYKFAIDIYRECLPQFKAAGDMQSYYLTLTNLGDALTQTKNFDAAKKALNEADTGLKKFGHKELTGINTFRMATLLAKQGYDDKALQAYDTALSELKSSGSVRIAEIGGQYIDYLNDHKNYEKALKVIAFVESSKKISMANMGEQLSYQNAAAETYKAANKEKEAIKAYQNTITLMDSIASAQKKVAVDEVQAKFQTDLQRQKNHALEANNQSLQRQMETEKILIYLYAIISVSLIVLILLFLRAYWLKNRLQKEELKSIENEKDIIIQQHQHEQEITNAQKEIIDEKQRELTSTALRMANYQDNINDIIDKCNNTPNINISDIKKDLQLLMKQKDYWKQFETRFNTLHPEFGNILTSRFSKLTKNDIEFCSLLKLNLSNKEIASLLQISHESAITKKYRIKKKMGINDDAEFEQLLMKI